MNEEKRTYKKAHKAYREFKVWNSLAIWAEKHPNSKISQKIGPMVKKQSYEKSLEVDSEIKRYFDLLLNK